MNPVLECLIYPTSREEFFAHYWGKEYLVSRQKADSRLALFSWQGLNEILSTQRFDFPRLRVVRSGKVVPGERYINRYVDRRGRPYTSHDSHAVAQFLREGCVLHITSIEEAWKPLASFAAQLEVELDARVQVNVHGGFAASRGFDVHWDGHDVFAVQLEGTKKWRLFGFTEEAPRAVPPDQKGGAPSESVWEGILTAGDVLYIPRGYWHAAEAFEDASLHLTFAAQHPAGLDFLGSVLAELAKSGKIRKDIPIAGFGTVANGITAKEKYVSDIRAVLCDAVSTQALDQFIADFRTGLGKTNHIDSITPAKKE